MRRARHLLAAVTVAAGPWLGCGEATPSPPLEPLGQATEPLPVAEEVVFDWDLTLAEERRRWRLASPRSPGPDSGVDPPGLQPPRLDGKAEAERRADFAAPEVEILEIRFAGHRSAKIRVWWRSEEQPDFHPERSLTLEHRDGRMEDGDRLYRVEVASLPAWRAVDHFKITLRSGGPERILERIRGLRRSLAETPSASAAGLHRIELGAEVRDGFLVSGEGVESRLLRLPRGPRAHFAWGFLGTPRGPLTLELFLETQAGSGRESELVWSHEVETVPEPSWQEASADLGPWAGQNVKLAFRVRNQAGRREGNAPESEVDLEARTSTWMRARGMPVWGDLWISSPADPDDRSDIVLISVDTLRADRIHPVDPPRETAPHLGAWARQHAASFENLAVQGTWTLPSHASMLTGLDVMDHGVIHVGSRLAASREAIAEALRSAGYRTYGMTEPGWLHPRFGLDQGFQVYKMRPRGMADQSWLELQVATTTERLRRRNRPPSFTFLHTNLVHEYRRNHRGIDPELAYDRSVKALDLALLPLLDLVTSAEHRRRTLFMLTSDHGELLGEQGEHGHGYFHEANIRAPLLVQWPTGLAAGRAFGQQVRTVDLVPTILEAVDLAPPDDLEGRSLLPLLRGEAERGVRLARSYSTGGDYGLALRTDEGFKYTLRNSFRRGETQPRQELWRIDGRGNQEPMDLLGSSHAEHLHRIASRSLDSMNGLHLTFDACPADAVVRLIPPQKTLDLLAVRSVDLPSGSWHRWSRRGLEAKIPAAGGSLVLEQLPEKNLRLTLLLGDEQVLDLPIDLAAAERDDNGFRSARDGSRERTVTAAESCRLQLTWRSHGGASIDVASTADAEVERQLKALGYLGDS